MQQLMSWVSKIKTQHIIHEKEKTHTLNNTFKITASVSH